VKIIDFVIEGSTDKMKKTTQPREFISQYPIKCDVDLMYNV
jgi:hypothetical protein